MKCTVVYHRADFDGLFSGAVCWHWLTKPGHDVSMQGWDFGDPVVELESSGPVYIVDLPFDCIGETRASSSSVVWIDHHKSSIDKFGDGPCGYRIDGVAACRLAWQWFLLNLGAYDPGDLDKIAGRHEYVDRRVSEPMALTLAGEYDVWDKRDPDAEAFQFGLTANGPWTPERLARVFFAHDLRESVHPECAPFVKDGRAAMRWQQAYAQDVCRGRGYYVELGGNRYWALASVHARNSSWFPNEAVPEDANGLLCYRIEGDGQVKVSLYNREGCEDIDHSAIAVSHGGGGHKGACGFSLGLAEAIELGIVR